MPTENRAVVDAGSNLLVRRVLDDQWGRALDTAIHVDDEMLLHGYDLYGGSRDQALTRYFLSGLNVISALNQIAAWRWGNLGNAGRILDFASGFGRVTRFLVELTGRERVTVSDLYPKAMEFQRERFGVEAFVSTTQPEALPLSGPFDLINVTSLFTHLPGPRFEAWLRRLLDLLSPGGVLCFTVHDVALLEGRVSVPAEGILFSRDSESRSLDPDEYGSTWVTEQYVRSVLQRAAPQVSLTRIPRAIGDYQDLYVAVNEPGVSFEQFDFDAGCTGFLHTFEVRDDGRCHTFGWVASRTGTHPPARVEIAINGVVAASVDQFYPRDDVAALLSIPSTRNSGWGCTVDRPAPRSNSYDICTIKVISVSGVETMLNVDTVAGLALSSAISELEVLRSREQLPAAEGGSFVSRLRRRLARLIAQ
jgi:SAM-dependent methyltransferase